MSSYQTCCMVHGQIEMVSTMLLGQLQSVQLLVQYSTVLVLVLVMYWDIYRRGKNYWRKNNIFRGQKWNGDFLHFFPPQSYGGCCWRPTLVFSHIPTWPWALYTVYVHHHPSVSWSSWKICPQKQSINDLVIILYILRRESRKASPIKMYWTIVDER